MSVEVEISTRIDLVSFSFNISKRYRNVSPCQMHLKMCTIRRQLCLHRGRNERRQRNDSKSEAFSFRWTHLLVCSSNSKVIKMPTFSLEFLLQLISKFLGISSLNVWKRYMDCTNISITSGQVGKPNSFCCCCLFCTKSYRRCSVHRWC